MSHARETPAMLSPDQLRDVDEQLLAYLSEGRITPAYGRERLEEEHGDEMDYSRSYVQQRLARLVEHSHAENLYGVGLYELVNDPREQT